MDQTVTLPWYVIGFYGVFVISWLLYLSRQDKANTQGLAVLKSSFTDIERDIKDLKESLEDRMDRSDRRMEKIEDKIDKIYDLLHGRRKQ